MTIYVKSPQCLCLYFSEHIVDTTKFFDSLNREKLNSKKKVSVDLSELKHITAGAAVYLFALITDYQVEVKTNFFEIIWPKDKETLELFRLSGLFKLLKPGGINKFKDIFNDNTNFFCGTHKDVSLCKDVIRKRSRDETLSVLLDAALEETFVNINHHAYNNVNKKKISWWCYFLIKEDEEGNYLNATICDLGLTIPYTMRNYKTFYSMDTDSQKIAAAMTEAVTSTHIKGRGKGSADIQFPVEYKKCDNSCLFIYSGGGSYFKGGKSLPIDYGLINIYPLKGTVFEWRLYY